MRFAFFLPFLWICNTGVVFGSGKVEFSTSIGGKNFCLRHFANSAIDPLAYAQNCNWNDSRMYWEYSGLWLESDWSYIEFQSLCLTYDAPFMASCNYWEENEYYSFIPIPGGKYLLYNALNFLCVKIDTTSPRWGGYDIKHEDCDRWDLLQQFELPDYPDDFYYIGI